MLRNHHCSVCKSWCIYLRFWDTTNHEHRCSHTCETSWFLIRRYNWCSSQEMRAYWLCLSKLKWQYSHDTSTDGIEKEGVEQMVLKMRRKRGQILRPLHCASWMYISTICFHSNFDQMATPTKFVFAEMVFFFFSSLDNISGTLVLHFFFPLLHIVSHIYFQLLLKQHSVFEKGITAHFGCLMSHNRRLQ